jgi:hypothetical protein
MGPVSLKMYDKHGFILRIETTVNDVSFFKNHRQVEHRDGTTQTKWTSMKKGIYSLPALREVLCAANRRYLEFISASTPQPRGSTHLPNRCHTPLTPAAGPHHLRIANTVYHGDLRRIS